MKFHRRLCRLVSLFSLGCMLLFASFAQAARPTLTVSVLQFGTAHRELAAMQRNGLDQAATLANRLW